MCCKRCPPKRMASVQRLGVLLFAPQRRARLPRWAHLWSFCQGGDLRTSAFPGEASCPGGQAALRVSQCSAPELLSWRAGSRGTLSGGYIQPTCTGHILPPRARLGLPNSQCPPIIPTHPQHFLLLANTTHPRQPFTRSLGINHWSSEIQPAPEAPQEWQPGFTLGLLLKTPEQVCASPPSL